MVGIGPDGIPPTHRHHRGSPESAGRGAERETSELRQSPLRSFLDPGMSRDPEKSSESPVSSI